MDERRFKIRIVGERTPVHSETGDCEPANVLLGDGKRVGIRRPKEECRLA
jgi:hypothetical protein